MASTGYGPVGVMGSVTSANNALDTYTVPGYGCHFTAAEDHITGRSIVYASRYTPDINNPIQGATDIMAYDFGSGTVTPSANMMYSINGCGNTRNGELQIAPDGSKLAWYQYDHFLAGFTYRRGEVYTLPLAAGRTAISGSITIKPISQAGNDTLMGMDFMKNSSEILYSQRGVQRIPFQFS